MYMRVEKPGAFSFRGSAGTELKIACSRHRPIDAFGVQILCGRVGVSAGISVRKRLPTFDAVVPSGTPPEHPMHQGPMLVSAGWRKRHFICQPGFHFQPRRPLVGGRKPHQEHQQRTGRDQRSQN